jgi:hypothetical protein
MQLGTGGTEQRRLALHFFVIVRLQRIVVSEQMRDPHIAAVKVK